MSIFLTLSELLPLSIVIYGIYNQIDWKAVREGSLIDTSQQNIDSNVLEAKLKKSQLEDSSERKSDVSV
jgi:hypothetical protein